MNTKHTPGQKCDMEFTSRVCSLHAAAPELLFACKKALESIEVLGFSYAGTPRGVKTINLLKKSIAKAEGTK